MNATIDSIISKVAGLSTYTSRVESLIAVSSKALIADNYQDISVTECLAIATDNNNAAAEELDDIRIALSALTRNIGNEIPREKIKNLSRDTGEIYHLLTFIIDGMRADNDINTKYEDALSAVNVLVGKAHGELFELGGV